MDLILPNAVLIEQQKESYQGTRLQAYSYTLAKRFAESIEGKEGDDHGSGRVVNDDGA